MDYDTVDFLLKEKGLSRRKLAELIGVSANTLSAAFRRKSKNIPVETVMKIGGVLQVDWWTLMGLEYYGNGQYYRQTERAAELENKLSQASQEESDLLIAFNRLNDEGKRECLKRVQEMVELARYRKE